MISIVTELLDAIEEYRVQVEAKSLFIEKSESRIAELKATIGESSEYVFMK